MRHKRVLIACEFSGTVRRAFRELGHDAWSCDLLAADDASPYHYQGDVRDMLDGYAPVRFQSECDPDGAGWCEPADLDPAECDCYGPTQEGMEYVERHGVLMARPVERPSWDLMIAHPPCTYLTIAAEWAYGDGPYHQRVKPTTLVGAARRVAREEALAFVLALYDAPIARVAIENPVGVLSSRFRKPDQTIQPWQFGHDASKATCLWLKGLPLLEPTDVLPGGKTARRGNQTASGQNKLPPSPDRWKLRSVTYPGIAAAMAAQWGAND
jgi:hypothetical protein